MQTTILHTLQYSYIIFDLINLTQMCINKKLVTVHLTSMFAKML